MNHNVALSRLTLRLPQQMKEQLAIAAKRNKISLNGEVLKRLVSTFNTKQQYQVAEPMRPYINSSKHNELEQELLIYFRQCPPHMQHKIFLLTRGIATPYHN